MSDGRAMATELHKALLRRFGRQWCQPREDAHTARLRCLAEYTKAMSRMEADAIFNALAQHDGIALEPPPDGDAATEWLSDMAMMAGLPAGAKRLHGELTATYGKRWRQAGGIGAVLKILQANGEDTWEAMRRGWLRDRTARYAMRPPLADELIVYPKRSDSGDDAIVQHCLAGGSRTPAMSRMERECAALTNTRLSAQKLAQIAAPEAERLWLDQFWVFLCQAAKTERKAETNADTRKETKTEKESAKQHMSKNTNTQATDASTVADRLQRLADKIEQMAGDG